MKQLVAVLFSALMMWSCNKTSQGCKNVDPKDEETQLLAYATQNGFTAVKHTSGLYYQVVTPGSGVTPSANSKVYVTYTGKKLDNTVFDSQANVVNFMLSGVIEGWRIGLPLIQKGGRIRLLIPSALAYGCTGAGNAIPGNTPLFFDITLVDVQ